MINAQNITMTEQPIVLFSQFHSSGSIVLPVMTLFCKIFINYFLNEINQLPALHSYVYYLFDFMTYIIELTGYKILHNTD